MQITLSGHHLSTVTDALRSYTEEKIERLQRFSSDLSRAQVSFKCEKLAQRVEATLRVSGGDLHASSEHADMYAAVDLLLQKLSRQLEKHKSKLKKHGFHKGEIKAFPPGIELQGKAQD